MSSRVFGLFSWVLEYTIDFKIILILNFKGFGNLEMFQTDT